MNLRKSKVKKLKYLLEADRFKWQWTTRHPFLTLPQYRYVYVLRQCQVHQNQKNPMYYLWRVLHRHLNIKYLTEIPVSVKIGPGFYIGHLGSITINPNTVLGSNINIYQGALLGACNRGKRKGCPTVGDRCYIGTNAVIVGKVTIGNNVMIAPNAYVNFDVPDNSIVIGNPGQIIPSEHACDAYIPENIFRNIGETSMSL